MPQEQKKEEVKKDTKKEAKEPKVEKPKLLTISSICFEAAEKGAVFEKGTEGIDAHIQKTLADANQKVNIKGKPITPDNIRSQRAAWMADCKKERKGRWADVVIKQDDKGVLTLSVKKKA